MNTVYIPDPLNLSIKDYTLLPLLGLEHQKLHDLLIPMLLEEMRYPQMQVPKTS